MYRGSLSKLYSGWLLVDGEEAMSVKIGAHLSDEGDCGVEENDGCLIVEIEERSEFIV